MVHSIARLLCRIFFKLYLRVSVTGKENLPAQGGFIVASNHVSYLDPFLVGAVCTRKLSYMGRHDLFTPGIADRLLRAIGAFPVKRDTADLSALREAIRRVRNGGGLMVFPEGRRIVKKQLVEPEAGIGFLASKLNVPVIPAFVRGTDRAFPKGAKFIKPIKVSVHFGSQIHIERGLPYQSIAVKIMEKIRQL